MAQWTAQTNADWSIDIDELAATSPPAYFKWRFAGFRWHHDSDPPSTEPMGHGYSLFAIAVPWYAPDSSGCCDCGTCVGVYVIGKIHTASRGWNRVQGVWV